MPCEFVSTPLLLKLHSHGQLDIIILSEYVVRTRIQPFEAMIPRHFL